MVGRPPIRRLPSSLNDMKRQAQIAALLASKKRKALRQDLRKVFYRSSTRLLMDTRQLGMLPLIRLWARAICSMDPEYARPHAVCSAPEIWLPDRSKNSRCDACPSVVAIVVMLGAQAQQRSAVIEVIVNSNAAAKCCWGRLSFNEAQLSVMT